MTRLAMAAALALGLVMASGSSFVPGSADTAVAQTSKQDRAARRAAAREKRAAARTKRADCRRQAAAKKMGYIKRQRFLRSCMRG
jgi:hypothetical protein